MNATYRSYRLRVPAVLVLALALGAIGSGVTGAAAQDADMPVPDAPGFTTIDVEQLATRLEPKDFAFINVHIPYEGEIEGTDANIPFDRIADHLDKLPADKNAEIVLYCRSGSMSETAASTLSRLGYGNVSHVAGGMVGWQKSGRDIVRKQR